MLKKCYKTRKIDWMKEIVILKVVFVTLTESFLLWHVVLRDLGDIHVTENSCRGMALKLREHHGFKIAPVFVLVDRQVSWLLLPSSVSLLLGSIVQPEVTYFISPVIKATTSIDLSTQFYLIG